HGSAPVHYSARRARRCMAYKIAVIGATGNVGREMLNVLVQRQFPISEVVALASTRSIGTEVSFGDGVLKVKALDYYDFKGTDIALMSAGGVIAKEWAPKIAAQGCIVIDNSSAWRMDRQVPLVVPEVNADALNDIPKGIIANPNCSTAQLVVALKPLHDLFTIKRVVVSTYQSVSGAGKDAMDELFRQTRAVFVADPVEVSQFTKQIAFNVIPHIDVFLDSGFTKEEWKMVVETQKILDPDIQVTATCVRVPVFVGHSESVNIEFEKPVTAEKARAALRAAPGILVVDKREDGGYVTPIECAGEDATFVSRIRKDPTVENGLNLWIVADNLRKGAALNAVQIAESLVNRKLLRAA
ncbi:MAG TPA: aspartate-semialdehyde dehydrogenase, partial [Rhizomicrobium sp.]|nr:aspartate-semialdehyde dehydrogenase [Rhizomicrobium sp.]